MYQESLMGEYVNICLLLLENNVLIKVDSEDQKSKITKISKAPSLNKTKIKQKIIIYKYVDKMMSEKAGLYFKSLGDLFSNANGLDLMLSDLNSGHDILRN